MKTAAFIQRDIVSISDLNKEEMLAILEVARQFKEEMPGDLLRGCLLGSCFFEPSTRTRLSFEAAIRRLGGEVMGMSDAKSSSAAKGETLHDAMKVIGSYVDALVIRHPLEGAARVAAEATNKPVINAGDGASQHPSQTLLDLFTINECQGRLDDLHIAMMGDLRFGRTVHSLAAACKHFNARLYFIAPPTLEMPSELCQELREEGLCFSFHKNIEEVIDRLDILYLTRIQTERFDGAISPQSVSPEILERAKASLRILHPLPRREELPRAIDQTSNAYYFQQAQNGLYVRAALLALLLGRV